MLVSPGSLPRVRKAGPAEIRFAHLRGLALREEPPATGAIEMREENVVRRGEPKIDSSVNSGVSGRASEGREEVEDWVRGASNEQRARGRAREPMPCECADRTTPSHGP